MVGYGFIFSFPRQLNTELRYLQDSFDRYFKQIDKEIAFHVDIQDGAPTSRPSYHSSYLSGKVPSSWRPSQGSWRNAPRVMEAIKAIENGQHKDSPTTAPEIISALKSLKSNSSIHLLPADKGGAMVIWPSADYDREAIRQLSDTENYEELPSDVYIARLTSLRKEVIKAAIICRRAHLITAGELELILTRELKGCPIYFLPKVHKKPNDVSETFHGRPIAPGPSSLTFPIDTLLAELTAPLLKLVPGSIRDTPDLLLKLEGLGTLPPNARLYTADVIGLYPNIPWEEGIAAATAFYRDNLDYLRDYHTKRGRTEPPPAELFEHLLRLVLENWYIEFKGSRYFHQKNGTAMGACISVYFAITFMFSIAKDLIRNPPPFLIFFGFFIDDLIFIFNTDDETLIQNTINSITTTEIKLTLEFVDPNLGGPYLDTLLRIDKLTNLIESKPYRKPTSTDSFLHASSAHPKHVIRSISKSQFIRIKRLSSSDEAYQVEADRLTRSFILRGHDARDITKARTEVQSMDRRTLLLNCSRGPQVDTSAKNDYLNSFRFIFPYTPSLDTSSLRKQLDWLHATIGQSYSSHPDSSQHYHASLFTKNKSTLILSNRNLLASYFSAGLKKRPRD